MSPDDNNTQVILEHMDSQFAKLAEMISQTRDEIARKVELAEVKADTKVIKAAVTEHSGQLNDHEQRLTHLEAA
jgi:hypothetical protein